MIKKSGQKWVPYLWAKIGVDTPKNESTKVWYACPGPPPGSYSSQVSQKKILFAVAATDTFFGNRILSLYVEKNGCLTKQISTRNRSGRSRGFLDLQFCSAWTSKEHRNLRIATKTGVRTVSPDLPIIVAIPDRDEVSTIKKSFSSFAWIHERIPIPTQFAVPIFVCNGLCK